MRKHVVVTAAFIVGTVSFACEVQVGSKPPATQQPTTPGATTVAPTPAPAPTPTPGAKRPAMGRVRPAGGVVVPPAASSGGTTPPAPSGSTTPPAASGVLVGTNAFGTGTPDPNGWKGEFFSIPAGTSKMPALASMTPAGVLFASTLNVTPKAMTGGFPGIDATRNENFAILWEAPLVVDNEGDYTFRLVSDDGAQLLIDNTVILDNDGLAPNNTAKEKSGPVHLVKATHDITVNYFQATGNVALQLFVTKAGAAEQVCPTHL
jgi:hypothetical protein